MCIFVRIRLFSRRCHRSSEILAFSLIPSSLPFRSRWNLLPDSEIRYLLTVQKCLWIATWARELDTRHRATGRIESMSLCPCVASKSAHSHPIRIKARSIGPPTLRNSPVAPQSTPMRRTRQTNVLLLEACATRTKDGMTIAFSLPLSAQQGPPPPSQHVSRYRTRLG